MYPFSRGVGLPVVWPLSITALPPAMVCGDRWPANGLPQCVNAMPQYAIAHVGSFFRTPSKIDRDSGNQNEWSSATARLKSSLTAGLQEVSKSTVPTLILPPLAE